MEQNAAALSRMPNGKAILFSIDYFRDLNYFWDLKSESMHAKNTIYWIGI